MIGELNSVWKDVRLQVNDPFFVSETLSFSYQVNNIDDFEFTFWIIHRISINNQSYYSVFIKKIQTHQLVSLFIKVQLFICWH